MKYLIKTLLIAVFSIVASETFAQHFKVDNIYYSIDRLTGGVRVTNGGDKSNSYSDEYRGDIVIPDSVTYMGRTYTVTSIDIKAFSGCTRLTSVVIPKDVKDIFGEAFEGCTGLTAISLPDNVKMWYNVFAGCTNLFQKSDSMMINTTRLVVDTLKAEEIFNSDIKPSLIKEYEKGTAKQKRIEEIQCSEQKKVKTPEDLDLLNQAYMRYLLKDYGTIDKYHKVEIKSEKIPSLKQPVYAIDFFRKEESGWFFEGRKPISTDNNVAKGVLTSEVRQYLAFYDGWLKDSLKAEHHKIDWGWTEGFDKEKLPRKEIIVPIRNSFYRGSFWYFEYIGMYEEFQQKKGWEFLYTEDGKYHDDSYPVKIGYYVYDSHSNYRVIRDEDKIEGVYDSQGNLVYIPLLNRNQYDEFVSIKRLVYLKDYLRNKYEIHSQPKETQDYIKYELSKGFESENNGSDLFSSMIAAALIGSAADELLSPVNAHKVKNKTKEYTINSLSQNTKPRWDKTGENYIAQLEKDHTDDFGYVYMIERLSNVSFRVVYLNKQTLKPSYCAVITYRTGEKPYTVKFSTKLVDMPSDIPPVIRE